MSKDRGDTTEAQKDVNGHAPHEDPQSGSPADQHQTSADGTTHESNDVSSVSGTQSPTADPETQPGTTKTLSETTLIPEEPVSDERSPQTGDPGVLESFTRTLVLDLRNLEQTLPETSLKPLSDSGVQSLQTDSDSLSGSLRPRGIQSAAKLSLPRDGEQQAHESLDYVTLNKLGEGGMGTVHLARQVAMGRNVALKQIHQKSSRKKSVRDEFLTEAVLTGKLDHPNIIPVYEVGETPGGELFYSMKNIRGQSWDKTIQDLSLDENLKILIDVCNAMAFAHTEGVIHRDLKPQNIMTGGFGEVLVLDWGLAIVTEPGADVLASPGGTPAYMAPEMVQSPYRVGPRSDVYLLGAILFRLLTGSAPHKGLTAREALEFASTNTIVDPDSNRQHQLDPSGELLGIAMRAMETEPEDRYQTVQEFQQAVSDFVSHQESLQVCANAEQALATGRRTDEYSQYARAVFGFEEALTLWNGNRQAAEGFQAARLAYARCAERRQDYDLALSLLDEDNAEQQKLRDRILSARDEHAHRESLRVCVHAEEALATAHETEDYSEFARAMFGFEQALALWSDNLHASESLRTARLAYARCAEHHEDFDLALSLLDEVDDEQRQLQARLITARDERNRRRSLIRRMQRLVLTSGVVILVLVSTAAVWINRERRTATANAVEAVKQRGLAVNQRQQAEQNADRALKAEAIASKNEVLALTNLRHAERNEYNSDMLVAQRAWERQSIRRLRHVLDQYRTSDHLRGFEWSYWNRLVNSELITLEGHTDFINSVNYSPDGTHIVSGSWDGTLRVWDTDTGQEALTVHEAAPVHSVAFSPDGKQIVSGCDDGAVTVRDADTGQATLTLAGHSLSVRSVRFSPDGMRILSAGYDRLAIIWDAVSGRKLVTLTGHEKPIRSANFSPDGKQVASTGLDRTIRLWNAETGQETRSIQEHDKPFFTVNFSPDGGQIVSGNADQTVCVWDVKTGGKTLTLNAHTETITHATFSPDGKQILSTSRDKTLRLWDSVTGQALRIINGHSDFVTSACFHPNGNRIVSGGADHMLKVWDTQVAQEQARLPGHTGAVRSIDFSPDGKQIVSAGGDGTLKIRDLETGLERLTLNGHKGPVYSVRFSPDGTRVVSGGGLGGRNNRPPFGELKIRDAQTGQELLTLAGHTIPVFSVEFSPDGTRIISAGCDDNKKRRAPAGELRIWEAESGEELLVLQGHTLPVRTAAFSPDGKRIVTGGGLMDHVERLEGRGEILLWDSETGALLQNFEGIQSQVNSVCFSPDGSQIASGSRDRVLQLWNADTGKNLFSKSGTHQINLSCVQFSPDGRRIVSSGGHTVTLWDVDTAREILMLTERSRVREVRFSPDGQQIAGSMDDGTVIIWSAR